MYRSSRARLLPEDRNLEEIPTRVHIDMDKCLNYLIRGRHLYHFGDKTICGCRSPFIHHCASCQIGMVQVADYDGRKQLWEDEQGQIVSNVFANFISSP